MSTLIYMKILEQTPEKYDRGMRILTFGRIDRIKREIALTQVEAGDEVLEIGCGTGTLAAMMSARGAHVVGIDISEGMLAAARRNAPEAEFIHMTATEIGRLGKERFDRIVATLSFSELTEDELDLVLQASTVLLKAGGKLVVADEVLPCRWWSRVAARLIRWPLAAITFLLTQNTTHALRMFEARLGRAGFEVASRKDHLFGTLALIKAEKS
ncbi:MAG: corrinoid protein-associated methyltransferase CpaM [Nitrospirota bacterium]|nr:corrinoid protein-associated methyltransferase CpaM [Nitrospirota bacterium]